MNERISNQQQDADTVIAQGHDLAPLVWRGTLLTVLTLGFYRFWYRTELRKWYARNTSVGGDRLDFAGTPRELLIGFGVAIVIIIPLYAVLTAVSFFASESTTELITLGFICLLVFLGQYGAFRARRYRLTRTAWRGIRFDQDGSSWRYASLSLGYGALTVVSLGLLFPVLRRALERYRINHTRFASARGHFEVPLWPLMRRFMPLWLLFIVPLSIAGYNSWRASVLPEGFIQDHYLGVVSFWMILTLILPVVLWPYYKAGEFRLFSNGTRVGDVTFISSLSSMRLYGQYLLIILVLCLIFYGGYALLQRLGIYDDLTLEILSGEADLSLRSISWFVAIYLIGFVLFSVANECILKQRFWRSASASLTILNLASVVDLQAVTKSAGSALGEGFADALDFGGA